MFSDAFNLKGKITIDGIDRALKALSTLEHDAKDTAESFDLAFNKIAKGGSSLGKKLERSFEQVEAASKQAIEGFREMGKESLTSRKRITRASKALEEFTDKTVTGREALRAFNRSKRSSIEGFRELGQSALLASRRMGKTQIAAENLAASIAKKRIETRKDIAVTKLAIDAEREYYNEMRRAQRAQSRTASNRRAEINQINKDWLRSLTPAQRIQVQKNTEPEYNPRGANAKKEKEAAAALAKQRELFSAEFRAAEKVKMQKEAADKEALAKQRALFGAEFRATEKLNMQKEAAEKASNKRRLKETAEFWLKQEHLRNQMQKRFNKSTAPTTTGLTPQERANNATMRQMFAAQSAEQRKILAQQMAEQTKLQNAMKVANAQAVAKQIQNQKTAQEAYARNYMAERNRKLGNNVQGPVLPGNRWGSSGGPFIPGQGPPAGRGPSRVLGGSGWGGGWGNDVPPDGPGGPGGPSKSINAARGALGNFSKLFSGVLRDFRLFAVMDIWMTFKNGIRSAITLTKEFQQEMANLRGVAKLTAPQAKEIGDQFRTMYRRTGVASDPVESAKEARDLYALGYTNINDAMAVIEQGNRLGTTGFVDQAKAVELLGKVMLAYGADASEAEKYANALLASTDLGTITMEQFGQSIGRVLPFAVQSGMKVEELSAMVGVMTSGALRGQSAITGLGEAIEKFSGVHRTQEAVDLLEELGITLDNATIKSKGFPKMLEEIVAASERQGKDIVSTFSILAGSRQGGIALTASLDKDGTLKKLREGLQSVREQSKAEGGIMDQRQPEIMAGPEQQLKLFISLIKDAGLQLTTAITPAFSALMQRLNGDLRPVLDDIIGAIGGLVKGFTSLFATGKSEDSLKSALLSIKDGITTAIPFLADLKLAVTTFINVSRMLWNVFSIIAKNFGKLIDGIYSALSNPWSDDWKKHMDAWKIAIDEDKKDIAESWGNMWNDMGPQWQKDSAHLESIVNDLGQSVTDAAAEAKKAVAGIMKTDPKTWTHDELQKVRAESGIKKTRFDDLSAIEKRALLRSPDDAAGGRATTDWKQYRKYRGMNEQRIAAEQATLDPKKDLGSEGYDYASRIGKFPLAEQKTMEFQDELRRSIQNSDPKYRKQKQDELAAKYPNSKSPVGAKKLVPNELAAVKAFNQEGEGEEGGIGDGVRVNIKEQMKDLKHRSKTGLAPEEALEEWKNLLTVAKEQKSNLDTIAKIEEEIFKTTTKITKEKEKQAKLDRTNKLKEQNETLADIKHRVKKGELTPEEATKELENLGKGITDPAQKRKIEKEVLNMNRNDRKYKQEKTDLEVEAEHAALGTDPKAAELAQLDAEFKKYDKYQGDKTRITELYEKKRFEIEKRYAMESAQLRQELLSQVASNTAAVFRSKGENEKADLIEQRAANAERFLQLQAQVEEWRKKGMAEKDITAFIESEKLRIIADSKKKKDDIEKGVTGPQSISGTSADPRYAASTPQEGDTGETGFSLGGFSLGGKAAGTGPDGKPTRKGQGRTIDRKAKDAERKAAAEASRLAFSLDKFKRPGLGAEGIGAAAGSMIAGAGGGKIGEVTGDAFKPMLDINITQDGKNPQKSTLTPNSPNTTASVELGRFTV